MMKQDGVSFDSIQNRKSFFVDFLSERWMDLRCTGFTLEHIGYYGNLLSVLIGNSKKYGEQRMDVKRLRNRGRVVNEGALFEAIRDIDRANKGIFLDSKKPVLPENNPKDIKPFKVEFWE